MEIADYKQLNLKNSVVALGKFEGLHKGHMLLLDKIKEIAEESGLTSVVLTVNVPSAKAINVPEERFSILANMGIDVAAECEFSKEFAAMTPKEFVKDILVCRLDAKYVVVGEDFRFGCKRSGDVDTLRALGGEFGFELVAFEKLKLCDSIVSTSLIKNYIEKGDMEKAAFFMGRDYSISGIVAHGKELGRTIGFPTVNITPDKEKLLPPDGVYKSHVIIDDKTYTGITNIGLNPTVDTDNDIRVETHIISFDGDLYGKKITIYIEKYLRQEIKFGSVDELKNQIEKDKESAMHQ